MIHATITLMQSVHYNIVPWHYMVQYQWHTSVEYIPKNVFFTRYCTIIQAPKDDNEVGK